MRSAQTVVLFAAVPGASALPAQQHPRTVEARTATLPLVPGSPEATAPHAGEIEFVFNVLNAGRLPWRPEDRQVSDRMAAYWTNFAKTGSPNATGLPRWPVYGAADGYQVMHIATESNASPDAQRPRYQFHESRIPGR